MALSTLTIKMNPDVKNGFGALYPEIGMNPSLRNRCIPFTIEADEAPNAESAAAIAELLAGGGTRCKSIKEIYASMGITL